MSRIFLWCAALTVVVPLLACGSGSPEISAECMSEALVTHGPFVGAVTERSAKIWVRACLEGSVAIRYRPVDGRDAAATTAASRSHRNGDQTIVTMLEDLSPGRVYGYSIVLNEEVLPKHGGTFKTFPREGSASKMTFVIGTDLHFPHFPSTPIINAMGLSKPDFALFVGDNVVVDQALETPLPNESQADYESLYRDAWDDGQFRAFRARVPSFLMWDDHEILNDWDSGTTAPYPYARAAYENYAHSANPPSRPGGGVNYIVTAGQVEFYVLDTRTFRSAGESPDGPDKTMLGLEQKNDLKSWLLRSQAKFKLMVSSVWWNDLSRHAEFDESWPSFRTERDEIFGFIESNGVDGVVLISGDEHSTGVFKLYPSGLYEIAAGPVNWALDEVPINDPQILFKQSWIRSYGLYTVDTMVEPATLTMELKDENALTRFKLSLDEAQLAARDQ